MFSKIFFLLKKKFQLSVFLMLILMIFSTFVELLSLSSIPVFLIAITDSNTFQNKFPFFNDLFSLDLKIIFYF